jgi:tetratricopeptide (TPR) repeat protein
MPSVAELWFKHGYQLFTEGRLNEALEPLEQALAYSVGEPRGLYMRKLRSCYGVVVAVVNGQVARGRQLCEESIADAPMDPELYTNLAQVYLSGSRRDLAIEALQTALSIDQRFRPAVDQLGAMGHRRPPVFGFLERSHPINKVVGRIRHRLTTHPASPDR